MQRCILIIMILCWPFSNLFANIVQTIPFGDDAKMPLLYDYSQRCIQDVGIEVRANYNDKFAVFDFIVPKSPGYTPQAYAGKDGKVWHDDSVEILLYVPETKVFCHYIVNTKGAIYDDKFRKGNRSWNGNSKVNVNIQDKFWGIEIKIPWSDLDIEVSNDDLILKGNVGIRHREQGNEKWQFWSKTTDSIYDSSTWGTFIFSRDKPFLKNLTVDNIKKKKNYYIKSDITIKNLSSDVQKIWNDNILTDICSNSMENFLLEKKIEKDSVVTWDYLPAFKADYYFELPKKTFGVKAVDLNHIVISELDDNNEWAKYERAVVGLDTEMLFDGSPVDLLQSKLKISSFDEGWHLLNVSLYRKGEKTASQMLYEEIYTIRDNPIEHDVNKLDVSKYYPAIEVGNKEVKVARSTIDFSEGAFPRQIKVDGYATLSSPITVQFGNNDIAFDKTEIESVSKNLIKVKSSGRLNDLSVNVVAQVFYDGFIWYNLKITGGDEGFDYKALQLEVPFNFTDALYCYSTTYPDSSFKGTEIVDGGAPTEIKQTDHHTGETIGRAGAMESDVLNIPLTSTVSIATDENERYRGVNFATEGPRGWNQSNYDNVYEVVRDASKTTMYVNFSDGKKKITVDEINIEFGIQPTPVRKVDTNANFAYRINYCPLFMTYWKYKGINEQNQPITDAQQYADMGVEIASIFQDWTESQNYWKTKHDLMMKNTSRAVHKAGMKLTAYFGFEMANTIPEFPLYHDLALRRPTKYPSAGYRRRGWGLEWASEKMRAWPVSYAGFWGDRQLRGIEEAARIYDLDGVYLDGSLMPFASYNPDEGQGVVDPFGRRIVTWDVLNKRSFAEKLFDIGRKLNKDDWIIDMHSNWPSMVTSSLLSIYHTGETAHLFDSRSRMKPGTLRMQLNSEMHGVPSDAYLRPPYNVYQGFAQSLLVDSYVRLNSGGPQKWNDSCSKIWRLWDKYDLKRDYFKPFFVAKEEIGCSNPDIYISYFDTGKYLAVIVSNYWSTNTENTTLDLAKFADRYDITKGVDVWANRDVELTGTACKLSVPGENFSILVFPCY